MPSTATCQAKPSSPVINFAAAAAKVPRAGTVETPPVRAKASNADNSCPPAFLIRQKSPHTSANFTTTFEWLYDDKMKESTRRLRRVRRARRKDAGAAGVYDDAIDAIKKRHCADKKLEGKKAKLPDNQKIDYPHIDIIDGLSSSSFPSEVDRYFSQLISEATKAGNFDRASYLLDRRNQKLKDLKRNHQAVYEG